MNTPVSVVILTYNRPLLVEKHLINLSRITHVLFEVIVVDNHSDSPLDHVVDKYPVARLLRMEDNLGIAGRNRGMEQANGEIIITLDDDVHGITDRDIVQLIELFQNHEIGAVCFKVTDEKTGGIINWCHHRNKEIYGDKSFITEEITEGAVAFRKTALDKTGLYPEEFFISHEGPDLALRLMNAGYEVIYYPGIEVQHGHSEIGRTSWRRYYYDTRNLIWLIIRNYPVWLGTRRLAFGLLTMGIYSFRDGYPRYWLRAIYDGVMGAGRAYSQRNPIRQDTELKLRELRKFYPGLWYMVKTRILSRGVRI
ncbi:MAG TPA: glycosyltransferase family 2 protein [Gammaproteobacteria bacterium]